MRLSQTLLIAIALSQIAAIDVQEVFRSGRDIGKYDRAIMDRGIGLLYYENKHRFPELQGFETCPTNSQTYMEILKMVPIMEQATFRGNAYVVGIAHKGEFFREGSDRVDLDFFNER
jgi:hypothetical protein